MSRLSHLVLALFVVLPALGAAAQATPATTPVPARTNLPSSAKPAAKSPPSAAPPAAVAPSPVVPDSAPNAAPAVEAAPPPATEPPPPQPQTTEAMGMGEQPGGVVYGAGGPPPPAQAFPYQPSLPEWQEGQCPHGRCGPECRERCMHNEFCSEYNSCEAFPEQVGQEHRGLLLRATSGYGFGSLSTSKVREGSLVIGVGVDVGGAVIENLIVRGRLRGAVSYYRENAFGTNTLFSFGTAGVGIDYYFMPINIYLGGTFSVAGISRADEDDVHRSKAGIGLDLDAGKEWWISRHWGIGIALRATYIDVAPANILRAVGHIDSVDARLRSLHVGLQFSATFN